MQTNVRADDCNIQNPNPLGHKTCGSKLNKAVKQNEKEREKERKQMIVLSNDHGLGNNLRQKFFCSFRDG